MSGPPSAARGIAIAAILIAIGNIASRVLGLGRESVIAFLFGRGDAVDAFAAAWTIPVTVYDLLINGAISAALIPIFSEYAERDRTEFGRIVSAVSTLALLLLTLIILLMMWQAPLIVSLLIQEARPELRPLTTQLVRWLLPSVFFMGMAGLMTAVLYARRSFLLPAFHGAMFNIGIIMGALLLHKRFGIMSLAIGTLLGALLQVLLQSPGMRGVGYRPILDMKHPVVRRIVWLYAPVALGIAFSMIGMLIDRWFASGFADALGTMRYATTLIQFPLGLVAAAVSLAVLPTLSRQDADHETHAFRTTLAMGIKVVLLLVIPATAGLAALSAPLTGLIFERGAFGAQDTTAVALALLLYLPGLPAAAVDQVLIFAFYARKNTLTPNLVQGAAILIYLVTVVLLLQNAESLGFLALVLGNSAQWIGHALLMFFLLHRSISLRGLRLGEALAKATLVSIIMAAVVWLLSNVLHMWGAPALLQVGVAAIVGMLLYGALCLALRVEAFGFFVQAVMRRIGHGG